MFLLRNLKAWFLRLFKKPELPPVFVEIPVSASAEYNGQDLRFYTENYKIDFEMKKRLCRLIQYPEFRDFETYLDWRVNASAHRMKALLNDRDDDKAANEAAAIDSLTKITQDMQNFWTEVKLLDAENEILVDKKKNKKPKAFGEDAVSFDMQ